MGDKQIAYNNYTVLFLPSDTVLFSDLNIIFPVTRLKEMAGAGIIGSVAKQHFSFMGHITGLHLDELIEKNAPKIAVSFIQVMWMLFSYRRVEVYTINPLD
jgi:hypothetical protein